MARWVTTTQLLDGLRTPNDTSVWSQFCNHFQPVVVEFAKQLGLSAVDTEDAAQETMAAFFKAFSSGRYDPRKGRLSSWLFGVANRVILNLRGHRPLERLVADKTTGTSFWDLVQDDHGIRQTWETEWRQMVLRKCLEQVQRESDPRVFRAFELYGMGGISVEEVCHELGMSRNAIYIARAGFWLDCANSQNSLSNSVEERSYELS